MPFNPSFISNYVSIGVALAAAFLAALWLSLLFWSFRDIRKRTRDPLLRILALLVVAVLFLPGILIYLVLRPPLTMEEEYQQSLEEEALLQSIEDAAVCPGCGRHTQNDWIACPYCHTRLRKKCSQCGKLIELPWNICPYCATPTPGTRNENSETGMNRS